MGMVSAAGPVFLFFAVAAGERDPLLVGVVVALWALGCAEVGVGAAGDVGYDCCGVPACVAC